MPKNISDSDRAQCIWALANSFSSAATQLLQNSTGYVNVPTLFLLGHALELHLKAFLASQGMSDKELKRRDIGHDLIACLRACRDRGLFRYVFFSKSQVRQIARVNLYYKRKHLEYFVATEKRFGSIEEFQLIVGHISKTIFNPITEQDFRALSTAESSNQIGRHNSIE